MKEKRLKFGRLLCVLLLLISFCVNGLPVYAIELSQNGSENEQINLIDNDYANPAWIYEVKYLASITSGGADATIEHLLSDGYTAEDGCLYFDIANSGTRTNNFQIKYELHGENILKSGHVYQVGFWAKLVEKEPTDTERALPVNACKLRHMTDNNTNYSNEVLKFNIQEGTGEWTKYEYTFTVNSDQTDALLLYQIGGGSVTNIELYMDEFFLIDMGEEVRTKEVSIRSNEGVDAADIVLGGAGIYNYNDSVKFYAATRAESGLVFDSWTDEYGNKVSANSSYSSYVPKESVEYLASFGAYNYTDRAISVPEGNALKLSVSTPVITDGAATANASVVAPSGWTIADAGVIFYPGSWTENFNIFAEGIQNQSAEAIDNGAFAVSVNMDTQYGVLARAYAIAKNAAGEIVVQYSDSAYAEPAVTSEKRVYNTVTYFEALGLFSMGGPHNKEAHAEVLATVAKSNCDMISYTPSLYKMNAWVSNVEGSFDYDNPKVDTKYNLRWYNDCVSYVNAGGDPVQDIIDACVNQNIAVFLDLRMNDGHNADKLDYPTHTPFFLEHPEYWRIQEAINFERTLNYLHPEVREYFYATLEELLTNYEEIDGLTLDLMRHSYYFPDNDVERGTAVMTEFIGRVSELVKRKSIERGKDIQLAVRVPRSVEEALEVGFDVAAWDENGYVDIVFVSTSGMQYDIDIEGYDAIVDQARLCGTVHYVTNQDRSDSSKRRYVTKEVAYAAAKSYLDRGAEGIFWWNMQYVANKETMYSELGALTTKDGTSLQADLAAVDKNYVLGANDLIPTYGTVQNTRIYINENTANYTASILRVEVERIFDSTTQIEVYFNGTKLEEISRNSVELFAPRASNVAYANANQVKFYDLPLELLQGGWNAITIKNISGYDVCKNVRGIEIGLYVDEPEDNLGQGTDYWDTFFEDVELTGNNLPEGADNFSVSIKSGTDTATKIFPVATYEVVTSNATGESCIHFDITNAGTAVTNAFQINTVHSAKTGFAIEAGVYKVGFKAKLVEKEPSETEQTLAVNVLKLRKYMDNNIPYSNSVAFNIEENDGAWTTYEFVFVVPTAQTDAMMMLQMGGDGTANVDLYIADFYLVQKSVLDDVTLTGNKLPENVDNIAVAIKTGDDTATKIHPTATYEVLTSEVSGHSYIHFDITNAGTGVSNALQINTTDKAKAGFAIEAGVYKVGFKAKLVEKVESGTEQTLAVNTLRLRKYLSNSTLYANNITFKIEENGGAWITYEFEFVVPTAQTDAMLMMQMGGDGTENVDLYIADFYLVKKGVLDEIELTGNDLPAGVDDIAAAIKTGDDTATKIHPIATYEVLTNETTGESCIHFDITNAGTNVPNAFQINTTDKAKAGFAIEAGVYKVGFKAKLVEKVESETEQTLAVSVLKLRKYLNNSTLYANNITFKIEENGGVWTTYEFEFVVPTAQTDAMLMMQMGGDGTENVDLYIADFYLIKKVDTTALEAAIAAAEALNGAEYTENSYAAVLEALEAAKAVLAAQDGYTQEMVNNALSALNAAIDALEILETEVSLKANSLTLDGTIGVNFYVYLPADVAGDLASYNVVYTLPDAGNSTYTVRADSGSVKTVTLDGKEQTLYQFTCPIAAKEMTGTISLQIVKADNSWQSDKFEYSAQTYAKYILDNASSYSEEVVALVKAMLNYGTAAQLHFDYNTDKLANSILDEADKTVSAFGEIDYIDYSNLSTADQSDAIDFAGATLMLESSTGLRLYFNVEAGADFTASLQGEIPEGVSLEAYTAKAGSGYTGYIEVAGIAAKDLDEVFTIQITDADGGTLIVQHSPMKYSLNVQKGSYKTTLQNLLAAMYDYNAAANELFS